MKIDKIIDNTPYRIGVFSIARSGHHAIVHWMAKGLNKGVMHFANINEDFDPRRINVYGDGDIIHNTIYSIENFDLQGFSEIFADTFDMIVLVIRDPYNQIASSLKKGHNLAVLDRPFEPSKPYAKWFCQSMSRLEMMKQYMRHVLGDENRINESFKVVNYNYWFASPEYRKKIADELDITDNKEGVEEVLGFGGGSSFSKRKYNRKASQMDVLNRWRDYAEDERFASLLDNELSSLSERAFPDGIDPTR